MRIIYFDLDCIRADHLPLYGYHRDTAPNIDALAKDAVTFDYCYTSNSPCLPARAALFSGRFGINNGVVSNNGPGDRNWPGADLRYRSDPAGQMWMRQLRRHGIKTISFSSFADRHRAWWFAAGWSELHTFTNKGGSETADEVNAAVIPWLRQRGTEDNYFLHIHYWDIHSCYRISKKWHEIFKASPAPDWPDTATIKTHQNIYGPRTARDLYTGHRNVDQAPVEIMPDRVANREDFKMLIDGYDGAIRYVDHHIGEILNLFKKLGVLDETVFIVSGDHGDNFGEHGHYMDHSLASDGVMRRPLIIKWPGVTKSGRSQALVYQLDLAPTICELLNIPVPADWGGTSFAPALRGKPYQGYPYLVIDHGIYTFQRAVRTRDWFYIKTLHPGLYPIDEPAWLYKMPADRHMTQNLTKERPEVVQEHERMLAEWLAQQEEHHQGYPDPLVERVPYGPFLYYKPEKMVERLRRTGRAKQAEELLKRLSGFHPDLPDRLGK